MDQITFLVLIIPIACFSIFTSLLYIISKEKGYLFYLLSNFIFIFIWIVAYGDTYSWFPDLLFKEKIKSIAVFLHSFCYINFLLYHLNFSLRYEKLKKLFCYLFISYALSLSFFIWTTLAIKLVLVFSTIITPFIFVILKKSYDLYKNSVLFVIFSVLFLIIGSSITILSEIGLFVKNDFTSHAVIYGILIEVFVQTVGLGYHFRKSRVAPYLLLNGNNEKNLEDNSHTKYINVKDGKKIVRLKISDILYVKSDDNYCLIVLDAKSILIRSTLKNIQEVLPKTLFVRCHRSYIVSKDKITVASPSQLSLDSITLPLSKTYKHVINEL